MSKTKNILLNGLFATIFMLVSAGHAWAVNTGSLASLIIPALVGPAATPPAEETITVCLDDPVGYVAFPGNVGQVKFVGDHKGAEIVEVQLKEGGPYVAGIRFSGEPGQVMTCTVTYYQ